jgi:uncharacterized protein
MSMRYMRIMKLSLEKGADVNRPGGRYGGSAFNEAASGGYMMIVKLLLDHGVNKQAVSTWYMEVQLLLGHGADFSALQWALSKGYEEIIKLLLENAVGGKNRSAFQQAMSRGYIGIMKLLLAHSADSNVVDENLENRSVYGLCLFVDPQRDTGALQCAS